MHRIPSKLDQIKIGQLWISMEYLFLTATYN